MSNFRVIKDIDVHSGIFRSSLVLPHFSSTIRFPPNIIQDIGGGLAYDTASKRVFYNDGKVWKPFASSGDTFTSYSQIKNGNQVILPNTPTIITMWSAAPPYPTLPEWNLTTGVYTAVDFQQFSVDVALSWAGGISNLGTRVLEVKYFDFNASTTTTVKEAATQADPNTATETTQELSISLDLNPGDQVWLEVSHDAPVNLQIAGGIHTSVMGFKLLTG